MQPLVNKAIVLLEDARYYLNRISDSAYSTSVAILSGASVGQHTRHVLEFYQCLVDQLQVRNLQRKKIINYDLRKRDRNIEICPAYSLKAIAILMEQLVAIPEDSNMVWIAHGTQMPAVDSLIPSSLERELFYNIEHTIHHFALIRIGLKMVSPEIELPDHFGVAPSTMRFRQNNVILAT